jgi:hypothetical protein
MWMVTILNLRLAHTEFDQGRFIPLHFSAVIHVLALLSWKLKWAILIARCPSVVRLAVRLSVNFYIVDFFSRTTGLILTRLDTNYPKGEGILNCSNEGDCLYPRGDNSERVKIHYFFLNLLLQNQQANFNQTWYKSSSCNEDSKLLN